MAPASLYKPTTAILSISVPSIPEGLIPEDKDKSCHASPMFSNEPDAINWFEDNLVKVKEWALDHSIDVPPNATHRFTDQIEVFERMGYKVWNINNNQHATSYIKVISEANANHVITIAGRADYLVTKADVTKSEYQHKTLCVIEIQSKPDTKLCELQMQVYLLILMNTKNLLALVGFLVLDDGQCRAFKATRDEAGGCMFEMNDTFHVTFIAEVMHKVLADLVVSTEI